MDEQPSSENPSKDFNKLDLSQLQGFSFGTQWTQDKPPPSRGGDSHRPDGGERPQRRSGGGGDMRRDRRNFRKPDVTPGETGAPAADTGSPAEGRPQQRRDDRAPRRDHREGGHSGDRDQRGPRRDDRRGDFRGPRRDDRRPAQSGDHRNPRREGGYEQREHTGPYFSPFYNVIFYPEDTGFAALVKAIRTSCRTYELFEIACVVIGKNDRFVATIQRKQPGRDGAQTRGTRPPRQPAAEGETPAEKPAAPTKLPPLAISIPDGLPFDNEDAAIAHALSKHLDKFYDTAEVEVEPPKGNYQIVNKCGITGELLAPPNYHLYNQIVQQHHATRLGRMGIDTFRSRIETVRDPEVVKQWLEKMKKTTRYTWKLTPPAEGAQPLSFDSFDEARAYLLANARDKIVRSVETARMHGKLLENLPQGEIRRAIESTLDRQRRFPLDTANALRGRLRREGFTIFKKGSKGISFICAVKRKFRVPGQTFADSIDALIAFIEANPMVKAGELPAKFLGIQQLDTPAAVPVPETPAALAETATAPVEAATSAAETTEAATPSEAPPSGQSTPPIAPATSGSVAPFTAADTPLSAEDQSRLHRLTGDLRWLVTEGYVTEYIDGSLFTYPPMSEARKKEVENEDRDDVPTAETQPSGEHPAEPGQPAAEPDAQAPAETPLAAEPDAVPATEPVAEPQPEETSVEPKA